MVHDNEDFYRFTRSRFVQNEAHEIASRHIRFDLGALTSIVAKAMGSASCIRIEKFPDGMHSKALLMTMDNGREVVAKIPNPNAGQSHYITASEVATMDFMRNVLEIPVPKVHTWCSRVKETPVGAEFVVMEKAAGVSLKSVWQNLKLPDRFTIVKQIIHFQTAWTSASYRGYGSIYYASDLSMEQSIPINNSKSNTKTDGKFALGPITGRDWNDDGRQHIAFCRGPWETLEDYLEAVGYRETTCVREMPQLPLAQVTLCGPGTYQPTRDKKLRALEYYMLLFKYLTPTDHSVTKPSAWHGDLHFENIFVDSSDPTKITCIIDWQSTEVVPLFVQARKPYFLDYDGPQAMGVARPCLPSNFAELSPTEQNAANRLLLDQCLHVAYKRWIKSRNPDVWERFEFQESPAFQLLLLARSLLVDGETIYAAHVVECLRSDSLRARSGLVIPEQIKAEIEIDSEGALRGMEAMTSIKETIGDLFPVRGCVETEQYDEAKDALRQRKGQILDMFARTEAERIAWEASWPFDD